MSWLGGDDSGGDGVNIFGGGADYPWWAAEEKPPVNITCDTRVPEYHAATTITCAMFLVFGIIYSFFGYRIFKAVMFLTGFLFASVVVYLICLSEALLPLVGNTGVAVGAGILFGLITMLVQYVGLFMTGFHTGLFLGVALVASLHPWWLPPSVWSVVGIMLASGLCMAISTLYFQKGLTIIGTAVSGGAIIAATLDYFIEETLLFGDSVASWLRDNLRINVNTNTSRFRLHYVDSILEEFAFIRDTILDELYNLRNHELLQVIIVNSLFIHTRRQFARLGDEEFSFLRFNCPAHQKEQWADLQIEEIMSKLEDLLEKLLRHEDMKRVRIVLMVPHMIDLVQHVKSNCKSDATLSLRKYTQCEDVKNLIDVLISDNVAIDHFLFQMDRRFQSLVKIYPNSEYTSLQYAFSIKLRNECINNWSDCNKWVRNIICPYQWKIIGFDGLTPTNKVWETCEEFLKRSYKKFGSVDYSRTGLKMWPSNNTSQNPMNTSFQSDSSNSSASSYRGRGKKRGVPFSKVGGNGGSASVPQRERHEAESQHYSPPRRPNRGHSPRRFSRGQRTIPPQSYNEMPPPAALREDVVKREDLRNILSGRQRIRPVTTSSPEPDENTIRSLALKNFSSDRAEDTTVNELCRKREDWLQNPINPRRAPDVTQPTPSDVAVEVLTIQDVTSANVMALREAVRKEFLYSLHPLIVALNVKNTNFPQPGIFFHASEFMEKKLICKLSPTNLNFLTDDIYFLTELIYPLTSIVQTKWWYLNPSWYNSTFFNFRKVPVIKHYLMLPSMEDIFIDMNDTLKLIQDNLYKDFGIFVCVVQVYFRLSVYLVAKARATVTTKNLNTIDCLKFILGKDRRHKYQFCYLEILCQSLFNDLIRSVHFSIKNNYHNLEDLKTKVTPNFITLIDVFQLCVRTSQGSRLTSMTVSLEHDIATSDQNPDVVIEISDEEDTQL